MNPLIVIPDIHGRWDKLQNLLGMLCVLGYTLDNLVFLGDMIDRGPDSARIIDWLIKHRAQYPNTVILRGNHEELMLEHLETGNDTWFRPNNGGVATIASYRRFLGAELKTTPQLLKALRACGHFDFLNSLPFYHETADYFFSHAPIPKPIYRPVGGLTVMESLPLPRELYCWSYPGRIPEAEYAYQHPARYAVCGHIHRLREEIFEARLYDHICFLDAGCGCHSQAALAALILPEKRILYSL
ncbi:metallophosphoesterase [Candidatus Cyanaurora vandensis]|uniref:metallophosphoesterase n=1 Tax=Candidatus Cyanaurora vandensis TaxID=2714958 RepID=UPI00257C873B|nr:metallophosphoesterase [Candidatus Cyanaurora vandensis]